MKYIRKNGIKDPGSAITHGIALILAVVGTLPLLLKAAREPDHLHVVAMTVFMLSMILLYLASTVYHTFDVNGKVNRRLKKFDHMMISVLIAGSYTPICLIALHGRTGIAQQETIFTSHLTLIFRNTATTHLKRNCRIFSLQISRT